MTYWLEGAPVRPEVRQAPRLRSAPVASFPSLRARLRLALALSLAFAVFVSFVLLPPQRFSVVADGAEVIVISREMDAAAVLDLAGVDSLAGDVIVQSGNVISVERAVPVLAEVDGEMLAWRTRAANVQALLDEMGIEIDPYDSLTLNDREVLPNSPLRLPAAAGAFVKSPAGIPLAGLGENVEFSIVRAVPLTIVEDGRAISLKSPRPTIAMALREAGIRLGPADEVYPSLASPVVAGIEIEILHAKTINLQMGENIRVIYTHKKSLQEALAEAGFDLSSGDRVEPSLEAAVVNGMNARLVHVTGRTFAEREPILRHTVFRPDESLSGYDTRLVNGSDGTRIREYKVVIEDGVELERLLVKETVLQESVDSVIYYPASRGPEAGEDIGDIKAIGKRRMWATWYNAASSGKPPTHPAYGITYSGRPLTRGLVAVDPRVIPLGTRLFVPGYGFALAADTGGGIIGDMIDLGYPDGVEVDWYTGWTDVFILIP